MAKKAISPKKKVAVRKNASPKVVQRRAAGKNSETPAFKVHKITVYKKVQTAEGWKRSMLNLRKSKLGIVKK